MPKVNLETLSCAWRRLLGLLLCGPIAAMAASVLPLDLDAIIDGAATAFHGTCIETHSERDAQTGLIVTLTTFAVRDQLKGHAPQTHTIKQLGGRVGDLVSWVDGIPSFTPGEEYVVFLYGVSTAGFSSPVGLSQGRFAVHGRPSGSVVGNGRDFREMMPAAAADTPASVRSQADAAPGRLIHMDLDEFKQLVRRRAAR
jgi:hypothetical protein